MNFVFKTKEPKAIVDFMKSYTNIKPPDCSFFTEEGNEISVHKELFCQTEHMRKMVRSFDCCCNKIEMIFPSVTIEELDLMVEFLYTGQFSCNQQYLAAKVVCNLQEFFGFSKIIDISEVQNVRLVKEDASINLDISFDLLSNGQSLEFESEDNLIRLNSIEESAEKQLEKMEYDLELCEISGKDSSNKDTLENHNVLNCELSAKSVENQNENSTSGEAYNILTCNERDSISLHNAMTGFEHNKHSELNDEKDFSLKLMEKNDEKMDNTPIYTNDSSGDEMTSNEYVVNTKDSGFIENEKIIENISFNLSRDDYNKANEVPVIVDTNNQEESRAVNKSLEFSERKLFSSKDDVKIKEAINKETQDSIIKCRVCHKIFSTKGNLNRHKLGRCKKPVDEIILDEKFFENARKKLQESFFVCEFCSKQFAFFEGLKLHYKERCKKIDLKVFQHKKLLGSMMEEASRECEFIKKYGFCNENSTTKMNSTDANRKSSRIKSLEEDKSQLICYCTQPLQPFGCPICSAKYSKMVSMLNHLEKIHKWSADDKKQLMHKCSTCKLSFWKQKELDEHEKIHERTFNCSICRVVFTRWDSLKSHVDYTHQGKEKDLCEICKKEFKGKLILSRHISEVHERKKSQVCSICGVISVTSGTLKKHIEIVHEEKRPFSCHSCSKTFKTKSQFNSHTASVHVKKKPFTCEICGKGFFDQSHLRKHQDSHGNFRPHNCNICGARFKRKHHLRTHLKTIHETLDTCNMQQSITNK